MQKIDQLFGLLKFCRTFGFFGVGFWVGEIDFPPASKRVDISFSAGRNGISDKQRNFYQEVEQHYVEIIDRTHKILYETLVQCMPAYCSEYTREEILEDFELNNIHIPSFSEPNTEWSLSFMYVPHKESYSVYFDGWKPIYGFFDD